MNKNPLRSIFRSIYNTFSSVFGQISWQKPGWINYLNTQSKTAPIFFWSLLTFIGVAIASAGYGIHWYQNLPKPVYITTTVSIPEITPNEEELIAHNLVIDFGVKTNEWIAQSVAPLASVGKPLNTGIDITPAIAGQWYWNNDSQLIFYPSEDWQADQKYTVHFSNEVFSNNAKMERNEVVFTTKPFEAKITEFKFYQDPIHVDDRKAVATIEFNYPVDEASLEKNTQLAFQTLKTQALEAVPFSYTYDKNKRVAYLHSERIEIKDVARYLSLTLSKKISSSTGSAHLKQDLSKNLLIPDISSFLSITSASAAIIRNDTDRPEQVLSIETTLGVGEKQINDSVHVYVLPADYPQTSTSAVQKNYVWNNPGEVTQSILDLSIPLSKQAIPNERNYSTLHSFKFDAKAPRYLFIKIDKGMKGMGGFTLKNDYSAIIPVPEYPKEIGFLHKGSLLALGGEQKLSVLVRGVPAVKFELARVLPENINQLVTQTQGDFNNPYFINPSFNQQNISQIYSEIQRFDTSDLSKQQYTALDLGRYLSNEVNPAGPRGLFLLQATGWDETNNSPMDIKAGRMILITDLGLLVKDNQDGTHDVFVESITQGLPVAGATVSILGKNGLPILSRISDAEGRVSFPTFKDFVDDREPTVYIASINNDVSFIPYNNGTRQLNFSKFDIGGVYSYYQDVYNNLSAFMFSDRGIYRPGDSVHIGMIVKQAFAQPQPAGLPIQVTVVDARGTTIRDERLQLNDAGFMSLDFNTSANSPTGDYTISMFLVKDNLPQNILGSTSIRVSEFLPDRMKIKAALLPTPADGWISPIGLKGKVDLWNLYGAAATERKISARILLTPEQVAFPQFPDYIFADPLFDPKKPPKMFNESLTDVTTNEEGVAEFNLNLEKFEQATYQLTFFVEGFEADGGRSVTTQIKTLVSPLPYFIGYKTDGDLSYIKQSSTRTVDYIAVNPQLSKESIDDLKIQLVSLHPVTSLVKKPDGTYQYQSVTQTTVLSTKRFDIKSDGTQYTLPTQDIGDYALYVLGKNDQILSQLKYSVVGESSKPLAKNAELSIKLNKKTYKAGDDIELQITSPYTGAGLITIERDKVYAAHWFKTDTTTSVQKIHIPEDFQGNGYVNVSFIRDWNSPEIFINPLSYGVEPFTVDHEAQQIVIDLTAPEVAKPGEPLTIDYHTDKPGKIIVFAVDEGILQVARYNTPDPLAYYFQKHALEVMTQQTVDQILPKFIQDREVSAAGGDDAEGALVGRLNPFKRKTDLPVVFWSGIIDTDSTPRQLTYQVPDYFNGSLKIMAVAVSTDSLGSKDVSTHIKGDFIISPNVPTFVSPGDEFVVSASIANNIKDSGEHMPVSVDLSVSPGVEALDEIQQTIEIGEGKEKAVQFKLRATTHLGSTSIRFKASSNKKMSSMDSTLSVRPSSPLITDIKNGQTRDPKLSLPVSQTLYPEYRHVKATLSSNPLIFVFGLQHYLDQYPYGCTEQLTSKAFPLIAMNSQPWFAKDAEALTSQMNTTIQMLSQRQMSNGGFSYWPNASSNFGNHFASVYAMHFLTEARTQGFNVPTDLFFNGIAFLKDLASQNPTDMDMARIQSYAIYVLTRNELITTNYLTNLLLYLQKDTKNAWHNDITAIYVAASYHMLKNFEDASRLVNQYTPPTKPFYLSDFYNDSIADAQYLYLIAKHFPDRLNDVSKKILPKLIQDMNDNDLNTILSGFISLALSAYPQEEPSTQNFSFTEMLKDKKEQAIPSNHSNYQTVDINSDVTQITFNNPDKKMMFYQLSQSGFDSVLPKESISQGIEIFREYRFANGDLVKSTSLGSEIEVHIQIRALDNKYLTNVVIQDLLPGGFEVIRDSVKAESMDYIDIREDRVNFFGTIDSTTKELIYTIKATNSGTFVVPPIYAESMYHPSTRASGIASSITVVPGGE